MGRFFCLFFVCLFFVDWVLCLLVCAFVSFFCNRVKGRVAISFLSFFLCFVCFVFNSLVFCLFVCFVCFFPLGHSVFFANYVCLLKPSN